uniref:DNA primase n=1 Tax=Desulfobacca acetoxidans TaxID=60893 RepID=A0A7V4G682_9BACT
MAPEEAGIREKVCKKLVQERREHAAPSDDFVFRCAMDGQRGDARLLVKLLKDRYCFDHASGSWYRWADHFWVEDKVNAILVELDQVVGVYEHQSQKAGWQAVKAFKGGNEALAKEAEQRRQVFLKKISKLQRRDWRRDILQFAAAGPASLGISGGEWDRHPYLLACPNGVIDLRDGSFRGGRPEDYLKTICPTEWRGLHEPAPRWQSFLADIFDGDEELISFLKRLLGYSLSGEVVEHIFPILWGGGRNGKSTLLESLHHVLGPLSGAVPSELLLKQFHPRSSAAPSPDIMALRGKRLVWASEIEEGRKLDTAKTKWLVGGDTLIGRDPHGKRMVSFIPTHTLFLLTNHRPRLAADDDAVWERVFLVPFTMSFVDQPMAPHQRPRDKEISEKLKKEAPGILSWLVQGCLECQKVGLQPPPMVVAATREYRQSEDTLQDFFDDCCILAPHAQVKAGELYEAYRDWCNRNGLKPLNGKSFGQKLRARFSWKKSGIIIYEGIGLKM